MSGVLLEAMLQIPMYDFHGDKLDHLLFVTVVLTADGIHQNQGQRMMIMKAGKEKGDNLFYTFRQHYAVRSSQR